MIIPGCDLSLYWFSSYVPLSHTLFSSFLSLFIFICILDLLPRLVSSSLSNPTDIYANDDIGDQDVSMANSMDENKNSQ